MSNFRCKCFQIIFFVIPILFTFYQPSISITQLKSHPRFAGQKSKFLTVGNYTLHYRDEGLQTSKRVLILLHGICSSLHTWDNFVKHILSNDNFRVIRLDLPGFGLTGKSPNNLVQDYQSLAKTQVLKQFLDILNIDKVYLVGNSLGGNLAWRFAVEYPHRVEKLVLISSVGYQRTDWPLYITLLKVPVLNHLIRFFSPKFLFYPIVSEVYGNKSRITQDVIDVYYNMWLREGNREALLPHIQVLCEDIQQELIRRVKTPTLILWGKKDEWVPVSHAYKFHSDIVNSEMIIYEDVGHVSMEEIPEQTAKDVLKFCNK